METRVLGTTGRKVSRLGFGGAPAGLKDYVFPFDPDDASAAEGVINAIRRAIELGVTYFDTAAGYGDGRGEEIFGEGLADIPDSEIFLATKCAPCGPGDVRRSLERSLKCLRRDSIDLLQIHGIIADPDIDTILSDGGMSNEMEKMRDEGLVRHLGFTTEAQNRALYRLIETGRFEVLQTSYNLIFQHPYDPHFETGIMYEASKRHMGIVTMRSLTSGIFQRIMRAIRPDDSHDYTPSLLQFCLSNPLIDVVLVGMRTLDEIERNIAVVENTDGRLDLDDIHSHYPGS